MRGLLTSQLFERFREELQQLFLFLAELVEFIIQRIGIVGGFGEFLRERIGSLIEFLLERTEDFQFREWGNDGLFALILRLLSLSTSGGLLWVLLIPLLLLFERIENLFETVACGNLGVLRQFAGLTVGEEIPRSLHRLNRTLQGEREDAGGSDELGRLTGGFDDLVLFRGEFAEGFQLDSVPLFFFFVGEIQFFGLVEDFLLNDENPFPEIAHGGDFLLRLALLHLPLGLFETPLGGFERFFGLFLLIEGIGCEFIVERAFGLLHFSGCIAEQFAGLFCLQAFQSASKTFCRFLQLLLFVGGILESFFLFLRIGEGFELGGLFLQVRLTLADILQLILRFTQLLDEFVGVLFGAIAENVGKLLQLLQRFLLRLAGFPETVGTDVAGSSPHQGKRTEFFGLIEEVF